jgi:uncharacterized protein
LSVIRLHEDLESVPREAWDALVGTGSPFLEWDFLRALEESGCVGHAGPGRPSTGWLPRHLTVWEAERLVAAAPLYLKLHSHGEFVFDWSWAELSHRLGRRYYPKLVAAVPFSPVAGQRFLVAPEQDRPARQRQMLEAIDALCTESRLSGLHVLFPELTHAEELAALGLELRQGVRHRWRNEGYATFDDFLSRFPSKKRTQIRRERAELARSGVRVEVRVGDAVGPELVDPMHRFYGVTVDKFAWGHRYLNRHFFALLVERWRRNLHLVIAWQGDDMVGMSINVHKGGALYGRYWGGVEIPYLHFEVCYYQPIEWCIARGMQMFDPGAGGEHKGPRGFVAEAQPSVHRLYDPELAQVLSQYLPRERAAYEREIEQMRRDGPFKKP